MDVSNLTSLSDSDYQTISNNKINIDKKNLVDRINALNNKRCNIKIFKIIHSNKINYSSNDNGVFFNISNLDNNQLLNIHNILCYYEKKKILDNSSNEDYNLSTDYNTSIYENISIKNNMSDMNSQT